MAVRKYFPTLLYKASLGRGKWLEQLREETRDISELDESGHRWSKKNYPNGFTSYASANELHKSSSTFAALTKKIDAHVKKYSAALEHDLQGGALKMSNCWVNVMPPNAHHGLHLHPLSVISGTFYLTVPPGCSAIKFEDPRLAFFMNAPPRKERVSRANRWFVPITPKEGDIVLFESWLRHEVPLNTSREPRVSVSFNYAWE